jgi:diacylglycerol kinase family enzyme
MNIILVHNSKAGSGYTEAELRELCKKYGIHIEKCIAVNDTLTRTLAPFIEKGATIVAVGGDGTLSTVAGMIAGTKAVLAPLPGGTLNHFTKDLGISQDIDEAVSRLPHATAHLIDVGEVNGTIFINNSSIGLYPSSLRMRDRFERYVGKWFAAAISSIRALVRFRTYTVTIDDETFHTPFVFVGNNGYVFKGIAGVTRESLSQGALSVFIARTTSRLVLFKIVLFSLVGQMHLLDEFDERKTTRLHIESKRKQLSVSRDGEVMHTRPPLDYVIKPGFLHVLY